MGVVYLAEDCKLNRLVAIKSIHHTRKSEKNFQDFLREAQFLARLNHKNIVQIFDVIERKDELYLVMEYIQGKNLSDIIQYGELTRRDLFQWLLQIAEGLEAAHNKNVIHRDLKTSNILIADDGTVKIADFGIARSTDRTQSHHSGVSGSVIALSPEQIKGEPVDPRSDIFSFAVLNYFVLFNCHPFGATDNVGQLIQNIIAGNFKDAKALAPSLPSMFTDALSLALQVDASSRQSHVGEFISLYQALLGDDSLKDYLDEGMVRLTYNAHDSSDSSAYSDTKISATTKILSQTKTKVVKNTPDNVHNDGLVSTAALTTGWRWVVPVTVVLAGMLVLWKLYQVKDQGQNSMPMYVKIADPVFDNTLAGDSSTGNKDAYISQANTIRHAFEQSIIQAKNVYLLPRKELLPENNAFEIRTYLTCKKLRCDVNVEKVTGPHQIVTATSSWSSLIGEIFDVRKTAQEHFARLMNIDTLHQNMQDALITEQSYQQFLLIYSTFLQGKAVDEGMLSELDSLISLNPQYAPLYELYCDIAIHLYSNSGDSSWLNNANARFAQASLHVSYTAGLYATKFELLLLEENLVEAKKIATNFYEYEGDPAVYYSMLSRAEMQAGVYDEAEKFMLKSLSYRETRNTFYDLANLYWYQGNYSKALSTLGKLFVFDPNDYYGLRLQALIYLASGDLHNSIQTYLSILNIKQESVVLSNLGTVYFLNGQPDKAKQYFARVLEKEDKNPVWMLNLADVEYYFGDKQKALGYYAEIINNVDINEAPFDFKLALPQAHAHLGDVVTALTLMNDLLLKIPDNVNVLYTAALVNALAEEKLTALVYMEKALSYGMGVVWFTLPMFQRLCTELRYQHLLLQHGVQSEPCLQ